MRHATPCPTVLSAPDHRLKTTPTLPGWMMVNEAQPAVTMKKTMARTTPLESAAGPGARTSSVMTILPCDAADAARRRRCRTRPQVRLEERAIDLRQRPQLQTSSAAGGTRMAPAHPRARGTR